MRIIFWQNRKTRNVGTLATTSAAMAPEGVESDWYCKTHTIIVQSCMSWQTRKAHMNPVNAAVNDPSAVTAIIGALKRIVICQNFTISLAPSRSAAS